MSVCVLPQVETERTGFATVWSAEPRVAALAKGTMYREKKRMKTGDVTMGKGFLGDL